MSSQLSVLFTIQSVLHQPTIVIIVQFSVLGMAPNSLACEKPPILPAETIHHSMYAKTLREKAVRLAQKMQVGPCLPLTIQL